MRLSEIFGAKPGGSGAFTWDGKMGRWEYTDLSKESTTLSSHEDDCCGDGCTWTGFAWWFGGLRYIECDCGIFTKLAECPPA